MLQKHLLCLFLSTLMCKGKYMNRVRVYVIWFLCYILYAVSLQAQVFDWVRGIGGYSGNGIAVDARGNSYVTGTYYAKMKLGQFELISAGGMDIFVAKFDAAGNLLWAQHGGGNGDEYSGGIAVDAMGNCYVTGYCLSNATFGSKSISGFGSYDVFLAKYDTNGECQWLLDAGGPSDDWGEAVAVNANGDIFLTGNFQGTAVFGNHQISTNGDRDVFVARYDSLGNCLWVNHGGGVGIEECRGISTDKYGNSYITGYFSDSAQFGTYTLTSIAPREIFIAKYNGMGNCVWAKQAQGISYNMANAISTDGDGMSTITGYHLAPTIFDQVVIPSNGGFIARYDQDGACQWALNIGTNGTVGNGVAVDGQGNSYVTGKFRGDVDFGNQTIGASIAGSYDAFIAKYNLKGSCVWIKSAGGASSDESKAITMDTKGSFWMTGKVDANADFGPIQISTGGAFVTKINEGVTERAMTPLSIPAECRLMQNFPNPFNPSTTIHFSLRQTGAVSIKLYDVAGKETAVILDTEMPMGSYAISFDGSHLSSGVYYYRMVAFQGSEVYTESKMMVLMK